MDKFLKATGAVVVGIVAICLVAVLFTLPVKWIVNYLFTPQTIFALFGVYQLSFWKAMALSVLCTWLFKGGASSK